MNGALAGPRRFGSGNILAQTPPRAVRTPQPATAIESESRGVTLVITVCNFPLISLTINIEIDLKMFTRFLVEITSFMYHRSEKVSNMAFSRYLMNELDKCRFILHDFHVS